MRWERDCSSLRWVRDFLLGWVRWNIPVEGDLGVLSHCECKSVKVQNIVMSEKWRGSPIYIGQRRTSAIIL